MASDRLTPDRASEVQRLSRRAALSPWRPACHLAPPCGLCNDPNGLHYDGTFYHVFCQWYPFGARHGLKHWYHFTSPDLCAWQVDRRLLVPDQAYEKDGCYSGNAWQGPDGLWRLYYTANYKPQPGVKYPLQAVATVLPDGHLRKSQHNPIIAGAPEGMGGNIRDPFVFDHKGATYLLLGAETAPNAQGRRRGALLLYRMEDPESPRFAGEVTVELPDDRPMDLGAMVECPGLIRVGDTDLLFLSLIGRSPDAPSQNRFASVVLEGAFDPEGLRFVAQQVRSTDQGFDFYAPQPFRGEGGTPLYLAWFGCGDQALPEDADGWRHAQTLPRLLAYEDGRLKTPPHPAVAAQFPTVRPQVRSGAVAHAPQPLEHLALTVQPEGRFDLTVGAPGDSYRVTLDFASGTATLDRSGLQIPVDPDYGMTREFPLPTPPAGQPVALDLYVDHSFHELYLNGGEQVATFRAYL